jgi:hypothetical protein
MKTVTQWFTGHTRPAHIGWYERKYFNSDAIGSLDYWDGELWRLSKGGYSAFIQNRQWRGLAEKP